MKRICELPIQLSNQIAAGEVIDKPFSVVKELVENSIDAHATEIEIDLEEAGLLKIRVVDNGDGIHPEDLLKAFHRHATSKIYSSEDLFHIHTLGFRGEALASIASVSKVTLSSQTKDNIGRKVKISENHVIEDEKIAMRQGTECIVEDLFFNTPARFKYIHSLPAELSRSVDIIQKMALAHPDISFKLRHENRQLLATSGSGDLKQTIAEVYTIKLAQKMKGIQLETFDFNVTGYISLPEETRAKNNYISLFVNGRYVKNYRLNRAILEGYGKRLMVGRFPIVVLSIKMDPILLDVNVHPTKQEVKFSKEKELFDLIKTGIDQLFKEDTLIPTVETSESSSQTSLKKMESSSISKRPSKEEFKEQLSLISESSDDHYQTPEKRTKQSIAAPSRREDTKAYLEDLSKVSYDYKDERESTQSFNSIQEGNEPYFPELFYIGQLHGTYLLAQNESGLYLIDQHAAQERINYENYKKKLMQNKIDQQIVLTAQLFEFTKDQSVLLTQYLSMLYDLGIDLEDFGNQTFALKAYPSWLSEQQVQTFIEEFIEDMAQKKNINSLQALKDKTAIMLSCKKAIKANHFLDDQQARYLLKELMMCEDPFHCPHGRPILVHVSTKEIEKWFKRIQDHHHTDQYSD